MKDPQKPSTLEIPVGSRAPKAHASAPIHVAFLLFDGFQPIDLAGPWQAFTTANDELGWPRYQLRTCGRAGVAGTADAGLRVQVDSSLPEALQSPVHTLIVPGGEGVHRESEDPGMWEWVRALDQRTERTCSVCTGAFLLASAGLLDGRRVTTHWRSAALLQQRHPALKVADERLFCRSGKYWTAAGVTAGIDLALALIGEDCGESVAQMVARRLVVYLRRGGDQRQYSQTLRAQDCAGPSFAGLLEQVEARLAYPWTVDEMADLCHMSRRTFQRKFTQAFGAPPVAWLKQLRDERHAALVLPGRRLTRKQAGRAMAALGGTA